MENVGQNGTDDAAESVAGMSKNRQIDPDELIKALKAECDKYIKQHEESGRTSRQLGGRIIGIMDAVNIVKRMRDGKI